MIQEVFEIPADAMMRLSMPLENSILKYLLRQSNKAPIDSLPNDQYAIRDGYTMDRWVDQETEDVLIRFTRGSNG